jgi:hypothetical protein
MLVGAMALANQAAARIAATRATCWTRRGPSSVSAGARHAARRTAAVRIAKTKGVTTSSRSDQRAREHRDREGPGERLQRRRAPGRCGAAPRRARRERPRGDERGRGEEQPDRERPRGRRGDCRRVAVAADARRLTHVRGAGRQQEQRTRARAGGRGQTAQHEDERSVERQHVVVHERLPVPEELQARRERREREEQRRCGEDAPASVVVAPMGERQERAAQRGRREERPRALARRRRGQRGRAHDEQREPRADRARERGQEALGQRGLPHEQRRGDAHAGDPRPGLQVAGLGRRVGREHERADGARRRARRAARGSRTAGETLLGERMCEDRQRDGRSGQRPRVGRVERAHLRDGPREEQRRRSRRRADREPRHRVAAREDAGGRDEQCREQRQRAQRDRELQARCEVHDEREGQEHRSGLRGNPARALAGGSRRAEGRKRDGEEGQHAEPDPGLARVHAQEHPRALHERRADERQRADGGPAAFAGEEQEREVEQQDVPEQPDRPIAARRQDERRREAADEA